MTPNDFDSLSASSSVAEDVLSADVSRPSLVKTLRFETAYQGLHNISAAVEKVVQQAHLDVGLATIFIRHTSASLTIQENADLSARRDLENWLNRLVPENDPIYTHTAEGPDDMPSHIKAILTQTSLSIPIMDGKLVLGRWQGIYLWEHRTDTQTREIVIHIS